jgi:protein required for attachment to host cells
MKPPAKAPVVTGDGDRFPPLRNCRTTIQQTLASEGQQMLASEGQPEVDETSKSAGQRERDCDPRRAGEPHHRAAPDRGAGEWLKRAVLSYRNDRFPVVADPDRLGAIGQPGHDHLVHTKKALLGELDKQVTGMPGPDILKVIEAA